MSSQSRLLLVTEGNLLPVKPYPLDASAVALEKATVVFFRCVVHCLPEQ